MTSAPAAAPASWQARAAAAAALPRQLFAVITKRAAWDPAIAAGTAVPHRPPKLPGGNPEELT